MPSQTARLASALLTSVLLLGCGNFAMVQSPAGEACKGQLLALRQCMFAYNCVTRDHCLRTCPSEAAALLQCEEGAPAPGAGAPSSCSRDLDCTGDLICEQGRCVPAQ